MPDQQTMGQTMKTPPQKMKNERRKKRDKFALTRPSPRWSGRQRESAWQRSNCHSGSPSCKLDFNFLNFIFKLKKGEHCHCHSGSPSCKLDLTCLFYLNQKRLSNLRSTFHSGSLSCKLDFTF